METSGWISGVKFWLNGGRFPNYNRKRSLFYLEVLKWQLLNRGVKRFYYKTDQKDVALPRVFCGYKQAEAVREEANIVVWSLNLRDKELY